jgi:hypothetical protein
MVLWENCSQGNENTQEIMTCKLIINKHENVCAGFITVMLIFQAQSSQGDQMIAATSHSENMTFDCFVFFCMSSHV